MPLAPGCVDFREQPGPTQLAGAGGLLALPAGGKRYEPGEEVEVVLRD
jgi:molybdopterin biosynthesis enzyme